MKMTGIILAGGKSSRMGSDKGFVMYGGKPLIQYAIDLLKNNTDEIIIIANDKKYEQFGYPVFKDEIKDIGPMGGIYTGLLHCSTSYAFVLSCDMPFMSEVVVHHLIALKQQASCVVPVFKGFSEPMCGVYHCSLQTQLKEKIDKNELIMQRFIKQADALLVEASTIAGYDEKWFANMNYRTDLGEADNRLFYPSLILVCGAGRNVGKTTLTCQLIEYFAKTKQVVGIKISPHQHDAHYSPKALITEKYKIIEETDSTADKDSNRFLRSGAMQSIYIEAYDECVAQAFEQAVAAFDSSVLIICESGALARYIKPGKLIFVDSNNGSSLPERKQRYKEQSDVCITTNSSDFFEKVLQQLSM